ERNGEVGHGPVVKSHAEAERRVLPEFIGPYPVLSRLGEGGMGEVFEIENTHLDRSEAVKVLTPTLDGALRDSLAREAKTHASLKHPHIARIYEYQDEPVPFIRMDLVRGTTLASILETNDGPLPLERVLELSEQIADALRAAHEQEITHRDLKPGNIMVTPEGDAVLLDFGIAKLTPPLATPGAEAIDSVGCEGRERSLSAADLGERSRLAEAIGDRTSGFESLRNSKVVGTLPYMSPEQLEGKGVTTKSDVWAFGALMFEMLSGRRLVGDVEDVLGAFHLRKSELPAATPDAVFRLVRDCLRYDPDVRPTARDATTILDEARLRLRAETMMPVPRRAVWPRWFLLGAAAIVAVATLWIGQAVQDRRDTRNAGVADAPGSAPYVPMPPLSAYYDGVRENPGFLIEDASGVEIAGARHALDGEPFSPPYNPVASHRILAHLTDRQARQLVAIATDPPTGHDHVRLFDLASGQVVQTFSCESPLPKNQPSSSWACTWQWTWEQAAGGEDILVTGWFRDGSFFQTAIEFHSPEGDRLGSILHAGHLFPWNQGDLDGDGVDELLLYGNAQHEEALPNFPPELRSPGIQPLALLLLDTPVSGQLYPGLEWDEPLVSVGGYVAVPPVFIDGVLSEPHLDQIHWGTGRIDVQLKEGRHVVFGPHLEPLCVTVPSWSDWGRQVIASPVPVWWGDGTSAEPVDVGVNACP
ncbi:MAG: serine/threonine protein kinase, partial [Candidatus Eisenbacteria bacterium]|nr:serine/threonine protein kinase [Candidatus Eisenbacteria bacterium]